MWNFSTIFLTNLSLSVYNLELLDFPNYSYVCFATCICNSAIAQCKRQWSSTSSFYWSQNHTHTHYCTITACNLHQSKIINSTGNAWRSQLTKGYIKMLHTHESLWYSCGKRRMDLVGIQSKQTAPAWVRTTTYAVNVDYHSCTPTQLHTESNMYDDIYDWERYQELWPLIHTSSQVVCIACKQQLDTTTYVVNVSTYSCTPKLVCMMIFVIGREPGGLMDKRHL